MKKKIILFLSFLMTIMLLTGCSTKVTSEKINEMTKIAEEIKENPTNYKLPEGYTVSNVDNAKLGRIVIETRSETNRSGILYISFDISKDEVQMIQIEETYDNIMMFATIISFVIGAIFFISIMELKRDNKQKK